MRLIDVDFKRHDVTIRPEKGSRSKIPPDILKLTGVFNNLLEKSGKVFSASRRLTYAWLRRRRARLVGELNNPRLLKTTFHTFRHWKAMMEYHKIRGYILRLLEHRGIQTI